MIKPMHIRKPFSNDAIFMAHAGAEKMNRQGYRKENIALSKGTARVITPAGKRYRTHIHQGDLMGVRGETYKDFPSFCNCPFALENGICKHQVWLSEKLDEEAEDNRRADEMAENEANADFDFCVDKFGM